MPLPLSGLLVRGVGLGAVEEYLKKKRGQRSGHPHSRGHRGSRGQFRTPGYDILECERGPPGPFRPDNEWPGGRPNGHPETCSMGNPWMHHLEQMAPPRRRRSSPNATSYSVLQSYPLSWTVPLHHREEDAIIYIMTRASISVRVLGMKTKKRMMRMMRKTTRTGQKTAVTPQMALMTGRDSV